MPTPTKELIEEGLMVSATCKCSCHDGKPNDECSHEGRCCPHAGVLRITVDTSTGYNNEPREVRRH